MTDLIKQFTIKNTVSCSGIGVHSGKESTLTLKPATENTGIIFIRTDVNDRDNKIIARWNNVSDTRLCTVLKNEAGVSIGTVEHILSAIYATNIDNIVIEVDSTEIPIMDGSSATFNNLLKQAGICEQNIAKNFILIKSPIKIQKDDKIAELLPSANQSFSFMIDFDSEAVGQQSYTITLNVDDYEREISKARTFGFLHEVEAMRSMGLAKGGSLENAVVIDGDKILNPEGLRYNTEFTRHKILDAIGDIALAEMQIIGRYNGIKSGHQLNNKLLHQLFASPDSWEVINMTEKQYRAMCSSNLIIDSKKTDNSFIIVSKNHLKEKVIY